MHWLSILHPQCADSMSVLRSFGKVSDAMLKLKLSGGGYLPGIEMYSPNGAESVRVCGPAYTRFEWFLSRTLRRPNLRVTLLILPRVTRAALW